MGRLVLITGLPNAGKTTYSARFEHVYHRDDFRKEHIDLWEIIQQDDVVIEGLFGKADLRRRIVERAAKPCTCIWLDTSLDVCLSRENRGRGLGLTRYHYKVFEPPTYDEGWDEIIRITPEGR